MTHALKPFLYLLFVLNTAVWLVFSVILVSGSSLSAIYLNELNVPWGSRYFELQTFTIGMRVVLFLIGTGILYFIFRAITKKSHKSSQLVRELLLSTSTLIVSVIAVVIPLYLWKTGITQYTFINEQSLWFFPLTVILGVFIYDAASYYFHMLLHKNKFLFKHVHSYHHKSVDLSVFSSYSLHPIEAVFNQVGYVITYSLLPLILPMSYSAALLIGIITLSHGIYIHCGVELVPKRVKNTFPFRYFASFDMHNIHHANGRYNYSIMLSIFDRLHGTYKDFDNDKRESIMDSEVRGVLIESSELEEAIKEKNSPPKKYGS